MIKRRFRLTGYPRRNHTDPGRHRDGRQLRPVGTDHPAVTTAPRPTLAAALIVRDEADVLPACLESLADVVDEIHVHDTGSADGTADIAAGYGAVVTYGTWTDDFAAARNAAQDGWTAEWVLAIDADERLITDPAQLFRLLAATTADVLLLETHNTHDENPYAHWAPRLYRPAQVRWRGRLHERLVHHDGTAALREAAPCAVIMLRHLGYADPVIRAAKGWRNVLLAQASMDELVADGDRADRAQVAGTLLDLGRSLVAAGRRQAAVDTFEMLRELFAGTREWLEATDFLARLVLAAGMYEACLVLADQLRVAGAQAEYCDWLSAQALAQLGDLESAERLLAGVSSIVDTAGRRYDPRTLHELRALVGRLRHLRPAA
jgi:Glycosyl transferase family 2